VGIVTHVSGKAAQPKVNLTRIDAVLANRDGIGDEHPPC